MDSLTVDCWFIVCDIITFPLSRSSGTSSSEKPSRSLGWEKQRTPSNSQLRRGESWQPITEDFWFSCLITATFFPRISPPKKTERTAFSLRPSPRCQRGSCCLLPGCIGRFAGRWARRLRRNRAARRTGTRSPPAGGPASLVGSPGWRRGPEPPGLCTWRRPLEDRQTDRSTELTVEQKLQPAAICKATTIVRHLRA